MLDSTRKLRTYILEEDLEDTTGLLIDETRNTLDTTTAGKTANSGLSNTLDVDAKNLAMALSATLAETLGNRKECKY